MKKQLFRYVVAGPIAAPATAKLLYLLLRDNIGKDAGLIIRRGEWRGRGVSPAPLQEHAPPDGARLHLHCADL